LYIPYHAETKPQFVKFRNPLHLHFPFLQVMKWLQQPNSMLYIMIVMS
jgi:hypothetical protein